MWNRKLKRTEGSEAYQNTIRKQRPHQSLKTPAKPGQHISNPMQTTTIINRTGYELHQIAKVIDCLKALSIINRKSFYT